MKLKFRFEKGKKPRPLVRINIIPVHSDYFEEPFIDCSPLTKQPAGMRAEAGPITKWKDRNGPSQSVNIVARPLLAEKRRQPDT